MTIWDSGTYEAEKLRDDEVIVTLHGERVDGKYALFQTKGNQWMIHRMSPPADPTREPVPHDLQPMLATAADDLPPDEENWAFEMKWDGMRVILVVEAGQLTLTSRLGNDATSRFPELRALGDALARDRRGARRRDRRPRRRRPSQLRAAPAAHAGRLGVGRAPARGRAPRRSACSSTCSGSTVTPPASCPYTRPTQAARAARARGPDLADTADDDRRRRRGVRAPPRSSTWKASSPSDSTAPTNPGVAPTRGAR